MIKIEAPWNLTGYGYILLYKFDKKKVNEQGFLPEFLQGQFAGGIGSIMIVNYETSNVGPYHELLLIPGQFKHNKRKFNTISKIYVSSMDSVVNGRLNWGIPKELADFKFERIDDYRERITVSLDDTVILDTIIKSKGLRFPMNTKNLPISLIQKLDNISFYTRFFGSGKAQLSKLESMKVNGDAFMDVSGIKPISVLKLSPFDITFPIPHVEIEDL